MHTRQHKEGQENAVTFNVLKGIWLCARAVGHVKTNNID